MASSSTRATDDDRNATCQALDAALGDGELSTEEHRQRVASATNAATLGELQSLVSDLQIHSAPVQTLKPPARRRGVWLAVAAAVVLWGALVARGVWPSNPSPSKSASATSTQPSASAAAGTPTTTATQAPPDLLTLGGLTGLFAQIRTKFGDTMGYKLSVYPDHAILDRPDAANAHKIVSYDYGQNGWSDSGSTDSPPFDVLNDDDDTAVGDLSKFDMQAILGAERGAPQTLQVNNANKISMSIDSAKNGSLGIEIYLIPDGGDSGYMYVATDGTVKKIVHS